MAPPDDGTRSVLVPLPLGLIHEINEVVEQRGGGWTFNSFMEHAATDLAGRLSGAARFAPPDSGMAFMRAEPVINKACVLLDLLEARLARDYEAADRGADGAGVLLLAAAAREELRAGFQAMFGDWRQLREWALAGAQRTQPAGGSTKQP